jgi:small subunit ribosomal protein S4
MHLLEKQRLRYAYWIGESQFRRYVQMAHKQKGVTGHNLIALLERRLDSLVYRMGFAPTKPAARQLVTHRHILVNGRRVDRPSYLVSEHDVVSVKEGSRNLEIVHAGIRRSTAREPVAYIQVNTETLKGTLTTIPNRDEVPLPVREDLVVEYYSKYL